MGISSDNNGDSHGLAAAAKCQDVNTPQIATSKPTAGIMSRIWHIITWVPPTCRYNPENPPKLTFALNILFGIACTFTVCKFFYSLQQLKKYLESLNTNFYRSQICTIRTHC